MSYCSLFPISVGSLVFSAYRYLTDHLQKVQVVDESNKVSSSGIIIMVLHQVNAFQFHYLPCSLCLTFYFIMKDFVIEALRSIAELITFGDQHDPTFFE